MTTTSPAPWRIGAELLRLCLVSAGLALVLYAAQAGSDRCAGAAANCVGSSHLSGIAAASATTQIDGSMSRGVSDDDDDDVNDDDVADGHNRDVQAPAAVSVDATSAPSWRVTALGIDPASFLEPQPRSLRAPPR